MKSREIENIARLKQISRATIDKDWVLGHFLNAFYLFEKMLFRGLPIFGGFGFYAFKSQFQD